MWLSAFDHRPTRPDTGCAQRVFEIELAVEVALDLGATDPNLQFMPLLGNQNGGYGASRSELLESGYYVIAYRAALGRSAQPKQS